MMSDLKTIIENANSIIELAECDMDCACDDFCGDDYRDYVNEILRCVGNVEETIKYLKKVKL